MKRVPGQFPLSFPVCVCVLAAQQFHGYHPLQQQSDTEGNAFVSHYCPINKYNERSKPLIHQLFGQATVKIRLQYVSCQ